VPPASVTEKEIVDYVAFFYDKGKGEKNFEMKTRLDKKWKGAREKPVEAKSYQKIRRLQTSHKLVVGIENKKRNHSIN